MVADPRPPDPGAAPSEVDMHHRATTGVLYSSITILGVIVAATTKDYIHDSWDLSLLVLGTVISLAAAHAWAGVMADVLSRGRELSWGLVLNEVRHALVMLLPAMLVVLTLFLIGLTLAGFDAAVTVSMLVVVMILFFAGYLGARRQNRAAWPSISWGVSSAALGLTAVMFKLLVGG